MMYYVGAIGFDSSAAISHARPVGSKNGYTTMKDYIPVGKRAKGTWDPRLGRYVYPTARLDASGKTKRTVKQNAQYAYNDAKRTATVAYNRTKNAVSSGVSTARNVATNAYSNARRTLTPVSRRVGNAFDVGKEFITGRNARANLAEQYSLKNPDETPGQRKERIAAARARYEKTLPGMVEKAYRDVKNWAKNFPTNFRNTVSKVREWGKSAIRTIGQKAREYKEIVGKFIDTRITGASARKRLNSETDKTRVAEARADYEKSLFGQAEKLGRNASRTARNVGKAISEAPGNIKKAAEQLGDDVEDFYDRNISGASVRKNIDSRNPDDGKDKELERDREEYGNTVYGRVEGAARDLKNTGSKTASSVANTVKDVSGNISKSVADARNNARYSADATHYSAKSLIRALSNNDTKALRSWANFMYKYGRDKEVPINPAQVLRAAENGDKAMLERYAGIISYDPQAFNEFKAATDFLNWFPDKKNKK